MTSAGKFIHDTKTHLTREGLESSSTWLVPKNSLLLSMYGSYGKVAITADEVATNQAILGIIPSDSIDLDYLFYASSRLKPYFESVVLETTQANLNKGIVENTPLLIPSFLEQQRISDILSTVDEQIQQTEEIIEETWKLKNGLMQDLFQRGIKYSSFTEHQIGPRSVSIPAEWEIYSVEELTADSDKKAIRGGPPGGRIKKNDRAQSGPKIYVQETVINNDFTRGDEYITEEKYEELKSATVDPGDVLVTRSGTVGRSEVFPDDAPRGILGSSLIRIKTDSKLCLPEYLSQFIADSEIGQFQIHSMSHGGTRVGLNNKIIKAIKVPIPPIAEQKRIIKILKSVDQRISDEEQRMEDLQELKRGLMQDLLTGKKRVDSERA